MIFSFACVPVCVCVCVLSCPQSNSSVVVHWWTHTSLSSVQSEYLVKLKSWVFTEEGGKNRKQKQPLCFLPTEGYCEPFRTGHRQVLCCWGAGSYDLWVPLAVSAADPSYCQPLFSDLCGSFLFLSSFLWCMHVQDNYFREKGFEVCWRCIMCAVWWSK